VRALRHLKSRGLPVRLYIAGSGNYEEHLRGLARSEGVDDLVRFAGWVPFEHIRFYLAKSDLCLIPHTRSKFIDTTIPNKLFQYMMMAKPVLVSDARPLARVVQGASCGFVFRSGDPESAATAIETAYAARADASIGERGRQAVLANYTWDRVSRTITEFYADLETNRSGRAPVGEIYPSAVRHQ
jgi:glycosyltransferase involved in cell wall biosynthesis